MGKITTTHLRHLWLIALLLVGFGSAWADDVAKIGETGYATLKEAVDAVNKSEEDNLTITLNASTKLTEDIECNKSFTLDLAKTITAGKYFLILADGVTVTTNKKVTYFTTSAEGKKACVKQDGTNYYYTPAVAVAQNGSYYHASLADAFSIAPTILTLLSDIELTETLESPVTAKGKTLSFKGDYSITTNGTAHINLNQDVTVKAQKEIADEVFVCNAAGNLELAKNQSTDNTYSYSYAFVNKNEAKVGDTEYATFSAAANAAGTDDVIVLLRKVSDAYTLTVGQTLKVQLDGYTLTTKVEGPYVITSSAADGITTYTTQAAGVEVTNTKGTVSYNKAFSSSISSSGIYKLLNDANISSRIAPGVLAADITIDLNGHTLTSSASDYGVYLTRTGTTFSIIDTSTDGGGKFVSSISASAAIQAQGTNNIITIGKGVTVEGCIAMFDTNNSLIVEGTVDGRQNDFAIATNGNNLTGSITIKEGAKLTSGVTALYLPSKADVTIEGGEITGATAIYQKSGTLTIKDGTFKGTYEKTDFTHNGNGANATGDALVVENCGYPGGEPVVSITGGTFESANAAAVGSYSYGERKPIAGFITSGTFSSDVNDFCAESYEAVEVTEKEETTSVWKVGAITATELTASTEEEGKFTATKKVMDGDEELSSQEFTITIKATEEESDAAGEVELKQVDLASVVESVVQATDIEDIENVEISVELVISAEAGEVKEEEGIKNLSFEVQPQAIVTISSEGSTEEEESVVELSNEDLAPNARFTFTLDLSSMNLDEGTQQVKVVHKSSDAETYPDETFMAAVAGDNTISITTTHFSEFTIYTSAISAEDDITLTDGVNDYDITTDTEVKSATYNRTFSSSQAEKYQAWFVPFDYTLTGEEGAKFYDIESIEGVASGEEELVYIHVTEKTEGTLTGNTPYFVVPESATGYTFKTAGETATLLEKKEDALLTKETEKNTYAFYGTYTTKTATDAREFLGMSGGKICWNDAAGAELGAYRWYITVTAKNGGDAKVRVVIADGEEGATGILNPQAAASESQASYNVAGQRVNANYKGIIIRGRKKYLNQ